MAPREPVQESWRWLRDMAVAAGRLPVGAWPAFDDILRDMVQALPHLAPVAEIAPPADFRMAGAKVPRQPHRYSGRTAMDADRSVHEPQPPEDPDSPLAFSMEGFEGRPPSALVRDYWSPGWNSVQALNKFQMEVGGPLRGGDPGRRLIEPARPGRIEWAGPAPAAMRADGARRLAVPLYHIFGSEELSRMAPAIAGLAPTPYVGLRADDAARLDVGEGVEVRVTLPSGTWRLPVRLRPALTPGTVGLPMGVAETAWGDLPAWVGISR
jgi:NADH-quinone oxidoreductase subunit G